MVKGTVKFCAKIVTGDKALRFPLVKFNPNEPGVDRIEIEGPNGKEIVSTIHLASVASPADGIAVATRVHTATLDRITFLYDIPIDKGKIVSRDFHGFSTGYFETIGSSAGFERGLSAEHLKTQMANAS